MRIDHLVGCGKRFADLHKGYHIMCGYDNLILGASTPGLGGGDGLMPDDPRIGHSQGSKESQTDSSAASSRL